jgi:hypothetical protein
MLSFSKYLNESCDCWKNYKRKPGTKPCAPGSCVKEETNLEEGERGLWDNIHAKQKRIKNGSGERMRKPGSKGAPTAAAFKASQNEHVEIEEGLQQTLRKVVPGYAKREIDRKMDAGKFGKTDADKDANFYRYKKIQDKLKKEEVEAQFDLIESVVEELALLHNLDPEYIWEKFEQLSDQELLEYAVDAKGHKSSTGGLTQKGRDAYNAKGANLQAPVTTPPSKLKKGSKAANRRKSFCARMGGMEGPMKKPNGEPTRKALALRKWNC